MTIALAAQLGYATYVVVWFLKFVLPGPASPAAADQDRQANLLRLFVFVVSVCVCAVSIPLTAVHGWTDVAILADVKALAVAGFAVFLVAVGTYHVTDSLKNNLPLPAVLAPVASAIGLPIPGDPKKAKVVTP